MSLQSYPMPEKTLFPKLVHLALGVPGVKDPVAVDLEEFDTRYGWILDSRIDQQGGT